MNGFTWFFFPSGAGIGHDNWAPPVPNGKEIYYFETGIADAGYKATRLSHCALEEFVQCACGCKHWPR